MYSRFQVCKFFVVRISRNFEFIREGFALFRQKYAFICQKIFSTYEMGSMGFRKKKITFAVKILKYFEPTHKTKAGRSMIVQYRQFVFIKNRYIKVVFKREDHIGLRDRLVHCLFFLQSTHLLCRMAFTRNIQCK